jgi:hypothetical protein
MAQQQEIQDLQVILVQVLLLVIQEIQDLLVTQDLLAILELQVELVTVQQHNLQILYLW